MVSDVSTLMRIIGQCNRVDFVDIEHLADITEKPEMFDTSTLSTRQRYAFVFLTIALRAGATWDLVRKAVKAVLFWGDEDEKVKKITIKFTPDDRSVEAFRQLWDAFDGRRTN